MEKKLNLLNGTKIIVVTIYLSCVMTLISCSPLMCSAYKKPLDRKSYEQTIKNRSYRAQSIPSPYTAGYTAKSKARAQKRYIGRF